MADCVRYSESFWQCIGSLLSLWYLFECLSTQVDMNSLTTSPMFFFFSVADKSLAYSKIMTEWLSTAKHKSVDLEESFVHWSLEDFPSWDQN